MLAGSVRWSVETSTEHPAEAAARTLSSKLASPSEKLVWVWQSMMGVLMVPRLLKRKAASLCPPPACYLSRSFFAVVRAL